MRQSQNIKASPNQLETFAVDHDRMNSSLHQDRSAAVIEKSKVKSLYSQPSSVSVKAGSVALQPVFGDLK
jgi:competence protein ComGC